MGRRDVREVDDGRTVVNMNVEGMPWYDPEADHHAPKPDPIPGGDGRVFLWGAVKAALLVVGVMSAGLILFVLFCQHVWLR